MSLVTRCPSCATTFKVVRDQLRISDGWVRCGRCSQVFDATVDLQEAPDAAVAPPAEPPPPSAQPAQPAGGDDAELGASPLELMAEEGAPESQADAEPDRKSEPEHEPRSLVEDAASDVAEADFLDDDSVRAELETPPSIAQQPLPSVGPVSVARVADPLLSGSVVNDEPWPDAASLNLGDEGRTAVRPPLPPPLSFPDIDLNLSAPAPAAASLGALSVPTDATAADDAGNAQLQKALRRARAKSAKIAKAKAREQKAASAETAPVVLAASEPEASSAEAAARAHAFSTIDGGDSFWRRPGVRRGLIAAAILGVLILVAQVLYHERDLIVARQPAMRPVFASLCGVAGCELSALRQIGDIKIDGASFSREKNDDAFRLSFTLRNAAAVPLAMPSVELSLLDTQERAVVRRVLMPSDFGAPSVLPARGERAASLSMKLTGPEAALMPPVAGYRVEAFYP
jgi:predicted Zn finger-like uncharacterized protein